MGIDTSKSYIFAYKHKKFWYIMPARKPTLKKYCFWLCCTFCASYWHIKWLNAKLIEYLKKRIFKRLHNWAISFCSSVKNQRWSIKKVVLKNLAIFTGITYVGVSLIKLQGFGPATLLKEAPTQMFSCEYCEIFKNIFFKEHLRETTSENTLRWWLTYSL